MIVPYNALLYLALIRPLFCAGAVVKPNRNKMNKKKTKKKLGPCGRISKAKN